MSEQGEILVPIDRVVKYCKKYRMRLTMIIVNAAISIIPLIFIGFFSYSVILDNKIDDLTNSVNILFNQAEGRIKQYFEDINQFSKSVFYNQSLQKFLAEGTNSMTDQGYTSKWEYYTVVSEYLNNFIDINKSVKGINLIDLTGKHHDYISYTLSDDMNNYISNFDLKKLRTGNLFFSGMFSGREKAGDEYLAVKTIKSLKNTEYLDDILLSVMVLDRRYLDKILHNNYLVENAEVFILDENNRIMSSTVARKIGEEIKDLQIIEGDKRGFVDIHGTSYMIIAKTLSEVDWKLVAMLPKKEIIEHGNAIKYTIIVVVIGVFVLVTVVTLVFNIAITQSIKKLADAFNKVGAGDLKASLRFKYRNEITSIADSFNNMVMEIKILTKNIFDTQQKLYETELEKKQTELNSLQSQINSHFLYNTLNCIRSMALTNETDKVVGMIGNLVSYLEYNSKSREYVTLKEEIDHLHAYLSIQNLTSDNKYRVYYEISSNLKFHKIIKLTLQPLIENAIFHGLKQKNGKGIIKIKVYREEHNVIIKLYDNGVGIDKDSLIFLNESMELKNTETNAEKKRESIGIKNTNRRIKLYYGEQYGLKIKSWKGLGTVVILKVPFAEGGQRDVQGFID